MKSIEERITQIFATHLGIEESRVTPEASLDDMGADSMDKAELIMEIEEEFNMEIPDADASDIGTVQQAVDYVKNHI